MINPTLDINMKVQLVVQVEVVDAHLLDSDGASEAGDQKGSTALTKCIQLRTLGDRICCM